MKTYKTTRGQNIFDVAVACYGSIEGLFDLLINNPELSFDSTLSDGQELYYDEDFIVYESIVDAMKDKGLVPVNGEMHIYHKDTDKALRCVIRVPADGAKAVLKMSGDGTMAVDWGDNTDIEDIDLRATEQKYTHYFDNEADERTIRLYGDFNIKAWDLSTVHGMLLPTQPLTVDEVVINGNKITLHGLFLFIGTYSVQMSNVSIDDLSPIRDMSLARLELTDIDYASDDVLDDYLIYVATHHHERRNCTVVLDKMPTGVYREPGRDESGNYTIASGMEAIYVLTHEEAWNAAGPWVFRIKDELYQYINPDIA